MPRFFDSAPILSWSTWLRRQVLSQPTDAPKVLPSSNTEEPMSPTGISYMKCTAETADQYSAFLEHYFCPPESMTTLRIPKEHFIHEFEMNMLLGVEVRTDENELVGLVFSRAMGSLNNEPARLITWFCVAPEWRRRGLADYLLFAIAKESLPAKILWFRNDGLPRSITPPVHVQHKIVRNSKGSRSLRLHRSSHEELAPLCLAYWKDKHPTGLVIDTKDVLPVLEWYSLKTKVMGNEYRYAMLVANLYEFKGTESACEILVWFPIGTPAPSTIERFVLDEIVSMLPYNRVEAPADMPHLESLWMQSTPASWYVYGYDVGTPVTRPILSLAVA